MKFKIGTNTIEREARRITSENQQRSVGSLWKGNSDVKRNEQLVVQKIDMMRKEVMRNVKDGREAFEWRFKQVMRNEGIQRSKESQVNARGRESKVPYGGQTAEGREGGVFEEEVQQGGQDEDRGTD